MSKETENNSLYYYPEKDFPYDPEGFLKWCVNLQGKTLGTAQSYLSSIRTAFASEFDLEMESPFELLHGAFNRAKSGKEEDIDGLEIEFESLKGYKELIEKHADILIKDDGEIVDAPIDTWMSAIRMYLKYIRWRIDRIRQMFGFPLEISDDKEMFINLPFSKEFRQYLKSIGSKGYETASIDCMLCKLRRTYNLFLRRRLKRDFMPDLEIYINEGHDLKPILDKVEELIDYEAEGELAPEMTPEDFTRGKAAFAHYRDFIKDYSAHPEKYKSERY